MINTLLIELKGLYYQKATLQRLRIAKYPGIPQANGNQEEAAGKAATTKCRQGVRECLKSLLNGKNKIRTISTYALLVVRYPLG